MGYIRADGFEGMMKRLMFAPNVMLGKEVLGVRWVEGCC
jgi:hypothetical protein